MKRPSQAGAVTRAGETWVEDLPWPAVESCLRKGALALLPVGAASKEHGPHLPHGSDAIQARYYAAAVAAHLRALIWPLVGYGYYPVFTDYPGSVSLREETFASMVAEVLDGIDAAGASGAAIINTGISTIAPLQAMLNARDSTLPVTLVNCYAGPRFAAAVKVLQEQAFGGHADEIETALMLAIAPQLVDMSKAVAAKHPIERGRFNRRDPAAPNYSPSGVNGDPTLATAAKGEELLAALLTDVRTAAAQAPRRA